MNDWLSRKGKLRTILALAACSGLTLIQGTAPIGAATPARPALQPLALPVLAPRMDCAALVGTDVSATAGGQTRVASASVIDNGQVAAYCNVKVVVDDYARFELHLPVKGWSQRLLFGGGPGAQTPAGVKIDQFASVSWEDLGRRQNEDVLANRYRDQIYAGYKGMHLQVLASKALIARFYGRGPRFSYYNACSNPGREGLIEAQRFPKDFDGIGAGCPPLNTTLNNGLWHAWNVTTNMRADGSAILTADKLPILHKAVLDACDAADGARDAIVSDPFACRVPFEKVECKPGQDASTCLTADQVRVARELYRGPHDANGLKLAPSGVLPGSELAWTATIVPSDSRFGGPAEARTATEKAIRSHYNLPALAPDWSLSQVKFDRATFEATTKYNFLHDATNTDMSPYAKAGGKLILWMALGDTNVLPTSTILYYETLRKQMGPAATDAFMRFYLLPGVYHCGGGDGPVLANLLLPLMVWVERGVAPGVLEGVHVPRGPGPQPMNAPQPAADLTRPIWPYPYTQQYLGHGDVRKAASFVRGPARLAPVAELSNWAGMGLYRAGAQKWCTPTADGMSCAAKP
ncbi:tannase/feruloyl esterase family alpha/beta hydrolase [Novosphingobium flavum]|uniref:Tannase/feruloyl esterase family alpha/beta hydrolase n=1 Tax=Novosphingobium flavum TaxID=1778672 RepID=A0A7X1KNE4_9SPHN|nr:tannase/feruloyl esterase family alpha/beta hydrolase [Novosphingobium flavum]MBC2667275.1 tannase/feruloyl esterase family alpha/beta hydrolase [Novosphingobium flavum]